MTLAAAAAIAAAAAVGVFAAAFALYAVVQTYLGPAGAAAVVAAVAALIVAVAGLVAARKADQRQAPRQGAAPQDSFGFAEKVVEIVKDRPLLSIGAALAAGVFALKNPTLTAAVAKAFMETRQPPR
ncbi:hypothetical protein [Caulobacter sp.]|uniref:hypothetical protein n=1 Tax=Caulobacter sp. TaxID=78 RepID=UPI003BABB65A